MLLTILLTGAKLTLPDSRLAGGSLLSSLMWINVGSAAFNMIPAFPMDGGRVLRALLAMKMDYVHATQVAAGVGQALALVFGFVGLFYNPFLVFIALFVWMGAAAESSMVQMKSALSGIPVSEAMITDFRCLAPGNSLQEAIEHGLAGFQHDFPVLDQGRLVGVLTRDDLLKSLAQKGPPTRVAGTMTEQFLIGDPADMLDLVMARLQSCRCRTLLVFKGGELVGILTMDSVGEFLMFQSALHSEARLGRIGMATPPARLFR